MQISDKLRHIVCSLYRFWDIVSSGLASIFALCYNTPIQFKHILMDTNTIAKIKTQLLEEEKRLTQELGQFTDRSTHNTDDFNAKFPQFGDKYDENASEVATYSDELGLEHTLEKELRDVKDALKNIEDEKYGICKYCHKPIDEKRLLARPTSSACISCKKQLTQEI